MERTCFAFKEHKHNQCECLILNTLECNKNFKDCPFYKHKDEVDTKKLEKEIKKYAKEKK